MPWYEEWFDRDEYELVYQERDETEAQQLTDLLEEIIRPKAGDQILDVGCGRGRHARVLARRGYRVTGLDLSARAVETARRRAADEDLAIRFEQQDMRVPFCSKCADGVVNLFSSFGYFEEDHDHQRAVRAMAAALRPGGWLFQDVMNAPYVRRHLVPEDCRTEDGVSIRQERRIEADRVNKTITLHRNGAVQTFEESVRLLTLSDFRRLYAGAGLTLVQTFGGYDGRPHTDDSPRLILYATKRS